MFKAVAGRVPRDGEAMLTSRREGLRTETPERRTTRKRDDGSEQPRAARRRAGESGQARVAGVVIGL